MNKGEDGSGVVGDMVVDLELVLYHGFLCSDNSSKSQIHAQ